MRKSFVINILFCIICFLIISCNNNSNINKSISEKEELFPKLKIINNAQITILTVSLEGYYFSDLNLMQNQSIILELKDGMPGGYENVTVSIRYRPYRVSNTPIPPILANLNFTKGGTTNLTIN